MQQTNPGDVIAELIDASICTHVSMADTIGDGFELEFDDWNASQSADVTFEHEDGADTMARILLQGDSSQIEFWVNKEKAHGLSDFFADLATDIEQRE
ncbi:hypothetical protein M196_gp66 [Halorubrum tailed virus 4]|uniref:Uncharacterized protein n=1 Tax=Halorubrum tailed virus 4 TaxID=1273752 RepID=R4TLW9_9CAUD|nr:hypothetical protein M196_gp66 [Halorubrum tailed virus 4]AGM11158.1 hypothetical protein HRTV4_66 [Halorubrum tailed virus 4]